MKKTILGSALLISGTIGFAIWQNGATGAASKASAIVYFLLAAIGLCMAFSSLIDGQ